MGGGDGGSGLGKLKVQGPLAGDGAAIDLSRTELCILRGLESAAGEVAAWARGLDGCGGNMAAGIDVDTDTDGDVALNRIPAALGYVGHRLVGNCAVGR